MTTIRDEVSFDNEDNENENINSNTDKMELMEDETDVQHYPKNEVYDKDALLATFIQMSSVDKIQELYDFMLQQDISLTQFRKLTTEYTNILSEYGFSHVRTPTREANQKVLDAKMDYIAITKALEVSKPRVLSITPRMGFELLETVSKVKFDIKCNLGSNHISATFDNSTVKFVETVTDFTLATAEDEVEFMRILGKTGLFSKCDIELLANPLNEKFRLLNDLIVYKDKRLYMNPSSFFYGLLKSSATLKLYVNELTSIYETVKEQYGKFRPKFYMMLAFVRLYPTLETIIRAILKEEKELDVTVVDAPFQETQAFSVFTTNYSTAINSLKVKSDLTVSPTNFDARLFAIKIADELGATKSVFSLHQNQYLPRCFSKRAILCAQLKDMTAFSEQQVVVMVNTNDEKKNYRKEKKYVTYLHSESNMNDTLNIYNLPKHFNDVLADTVITKQSSDNNHSMLSKIDSVQATGSQSGFITLCMTHPFSQVVSKTDMPAFIHSFAKLGAYKFSTIYKEHSPYFACYYKKGHITTLVEIAKAWNAFYLTKIKRMLSASYQRLTARQSLENIVPLDIHSNSFYESPLSVVVHLQLQTSKMLPVNAISDFVDLD